MCVISFDDGYRDNWTLATPVLERHAVPATLFVPRDLIRGSGDTFMNEGELRELSRHSLWQVGAHGVTHSVLTGLLPADQRREMIDCNTWLTDLLGMPPAGFAYPLGQADEGTVGLAGEIYDHALRTDQRLGNRFDPWQIRRHCPTRAQDDPGALARALLSAPVENGLQ